MTLRTLRCFTATLSVLGFVMTARPAAAQYMMLSEFVDPNGPALDSAIAVWKRHHASVSGSWSYSYFTADNGRRYVSVGMTSMADITRNDSITQQIAQTMPNREAWAKSFETSYRSMNSSIWQMVQSLSTNPNNLTTAQMQQLPYRRVVIRHVKPSQVAAFRSTIKQIIDVDTKLKAVNATLVYEQVSGVGSPAFLFVTYMPSQSAYWASMDDRAAKRAACNGCLGDLSQRFAATLIETENMSLTKILPLSFAR